MRRMRDLTFGHYVAVAVPVLAAVFGMFYWSKHRHSGQSGKETTQAARTHEDGARKGRNVASAAHSKHDTHHDAEEADDAAYDAYAEKEAALSKHEHATSHAKHDSHAVVEDKGSSHADCAPIEYRGKGPKHTQVTKGEWTTVMDQFHGAKHALLGWLDKHKHDFAPAVAQMMEHQVRELRIQRPPSADEPDLSWRGIGVYSQTAEGEPIVRLGGGFVKLAQAHPQRARFEITRLVAQAWAPCEMQRALADSQRVWTPLLACLGVSEGQACNQGSYSESGWAVSTTLAKAVSAPGCQIPAFATPEMSSCASRMPMHASGAREPQSFANLAHLKGGRQ